MLLGMTWCATGSAGAVTPVEEREELVDLCNFGPPEAEGDDGKEQRSYHDRRRVLVHQVYETPLPALDDGLMGYDRVTGLLTISGFRTYRPHPEGPAIRFRNECILGFEFDEEKAHDVMAQLQMGTVEVRIGYQLVARQDYDVDFCPDGDKADHRAMVVDLLYAQLVDVEQSSDGDPRVLGTYQTPQGHRAALHRSMELVDSVTSAVPEVKISHFQWRPRGKSWSDDFGESGPPSPLQPLQEELVARIERALYPCYVGALSHNAALQGALVLSVPIEVEGGERLSFLMDTLQKPMMRQCAKERISAVMTTMEGTDYEEVDAFKLTVLMRRR